MRGVAVLALGLGALSACSSNGSDASATTSTASAAGSTAASSSASASSSGATQAQSIKATEADFSISLDKDTLSAGSYTVQVVNDGKATHDLVVERGGNDVATSDHIG